eukprot:m.79841 g.79841  ORF g.79841 m.79841 type:complete len:140 (+) comp11991_c0_seq5:238-657(+)
MKALCDSKLHYSTRTARDYHQRHRNIHLTDHTEKGMQPKKYGSGGHDMSKSWSSSTTMGSSFRPPVKPSGFHRSLSLTIPKSCETKEWASTHGHSTETRRHFVKKKLVPSRSLSTSAGSQLLLKTFRTTTLSIQREEHQ